MPRHRSVLASALLIVLAPAIAQPTPADGTRNTLLLAQAHFVQEKDASGQSRPKPLPARLVILQEIDGVWREQVVDDPDSNVLHKATPQRLGDQPQPTIVTIGAQAAALKAWQRTGDTWTAETLWKPTFGGKWDRLRDYEVADVTGDGEQDFVVATHDQGVIAVVSRSGNAWKATEIDRQARTFVHEIELGDLDRDGHPEIYATPSSPNRADGQPQPGLITCYVRAADGFKRSVVEEFPDLHVKEILAADLGDGPSLLAALESATLSPQTRAEGRRVRIKQYYLREDKYIGRLVAELPDDMCRFLNAGDVDGDGKVELVAAPRKSGIWLLRPSAGDNWPAERIETDSGGVEHATTLADLNGDGRLEIYVASDNQRKLRRYRWTGEKWDRQDLFEIKGDAITFGIWAGKL